jgi:hypothetical protein
VQILYAHRIYVHISADISSTVTCQWPIIHSSEYDHASCSGLPLQRNFLTVPTTDFRAHSSAAQFYFTLYVPDETCWPLHNGRVDHFTDYHNEQVSKTGANKSVSLSIDA